jgi:hypothetical protein
MIMKVTELTLFNQYNCTNVGKQAVFQCYGVGTHCDYTDAAGNGVKAWIQLVPQGYTIHTANFYRSQFKLIPDIYIS